MVRKTTTLISLAFAASMFLWSQIRVMIVEQENTELFARLSSTTSMCLSSNNKVSNLKKRNKWLEEQVAVFEYTRPGRNKHLAQLKELLQQRNIQHGIGGN